MRTKRWMATCVVALLSVAAVLAKDIRVVIFKVSQMHCENCEKKVKNNMRFEKGVKDLSTELKNKTVSITYDAEKTDVRTARKTANKNLKKRIRRPIRSNRTNTRICLFYIY